ncbi:MAG TPA: choice-of-anchor L domain-containing protein, partial [Chitinophagaceae bacterium]|nr:choice-of-anchor L domain-containing protein [Chitinophagaceae bacterium]
CKSGDERIKVLSMNKIVGFCLVLLLSFQAKAQITVNGNQTAAILAQKLVGSGVTISNPVLTCDPQGNGTFTVTASNLGLDSGIILTSGIAQSGPGINGANGPATNLPANSMGTPGNVDLTALALKPTFDACILEFDFVPLGDTVKFDYVFASAEYQGFTCSNYGDIFGFFISGPGITGPYTGSSKNIALVPGTNCPVGVNTINGSTASPCGPVGPPCSPPNNALFTNNIGGLTVAYNGFTHVLTALSEVTPCVSHHLRLAVADASDQTLDTGVWIKAGSLSSNAISFTPISNLLNPYPYIVEGCASGFVKVKRPVPGPNPYTINYLVGGVANYPADYAVSSIPPGSPFGTVTIPPFDTVAYIAIAALQDGIAEPDEEIKIYQLAPCTSAIVDSVSLFISDTIKMNIITPDTAVCREDSVHILVNGSDSLTYTWTPTTFINNPNIKEPTVSPNNSTDYIVCATLPLSGCAPKCDTIHITINQPPSVFIGNDTINCQGMTVPFNPVITPVQPYTYTWSITGVGTLSNTSILNPVASFNNTGTSQIILHVEPQAVGCEGNDTMNVLTLPNDITLVNNDTVVCQGSTVQIVVAGHPLFTYNWFPATYLNDPTLQNPISVPDSNVSYTVVATYPGCTPMSKSFDIEVQPVPVINAGPDREMCDWDTVRLYVDVEPKWYTQYSYNWTPGGSLDDATLQGPVFSGHNNTNLQVIVSSPIGCADTDNVLVTVFPTEFATVTPETTRICPHDSVQFHAIGAASYVYTPGMYVNDSLIADPVAHPLASTVYTVYATSTLGCIDTDIVRIDVAPDAVLDAGDNVTLYPGETVELNPSGNCSFFTWFPDYHLTDKDIKNPIADPPVTTRYFVYGTTEAGCTAMDSIDIRVSPESLLDLPNAFSPGAGTGVNDELKIIVKGIATLNYFRIFNRWGQMIFESTDINRGWDGRFKGVPQPLGTYVYLIDAKTSTGKRFYKQGNITLIR